MWQHIDFFFYLQWSFSLTRYRRRYLFKSTRSRLALASTCTGSSDRRCDKSCNKYKQIMFSSFANWNPLTADFYSETFLHGLRGERCTHSSCSVCVCVCVRSPPCVRVRVWVATKNTKHLLAEKVKQPNGVRGAPALFTEGTIRTGAIWHSERRKTQRRRANAALTKHSFKRQSTPPVSVGLFAIASFVTQSPFYQLIFTRACARNMWEWCLTQRADAEHTSSSLKRL